MSKNKSSAKVLALELKRLQDDPVEGFTLRFSKKLCTAEEFQNIFFENFVLESV